MKDRFLLYVFIFGFFCFLGYTLAQLIGRGLAEQLNPDDA